MSLFRSIGDTITKIRKGPGTTADGRKELGIKESLIFASGDLFGGGAQVMIGFYYLIFLTDIVGLRPSLAGLVVLVSKFWDAISDPLMGLITDGTESRFGRRKPYFLAGFFGIIAAFLLLWYPISSSNQLITFSYVLFAYLFYSTVNTMVMVPYSAMSSEISEDVIRRNNANGMRLFFSQVSSLLCAVLPLEIVKLFGDIQTGYLVMAGLFGVFFAVPFLLIFFFTEERIIVKAEKTRFSLKDIAAPFRIRSFRILIGIYLSAFLTMDVVSAVFAYYMKYYLNRPGELNLVLGTMLITQIVLVPLVMYSANRIGKARTLRYSTYIWIIGVALLGLLTPEWQGAAVYFNAAIMGIGLIGGIVIPWIMYPDVTDVGELVFGRRKSGSFSGVMTFMRKLSSALGIFLVSVSLDIAGYIEPVKEMVNGKTVETAFAQPDSVITALKIVLVAFPVVFLGIVLLNSFRYPLSYAMHQRLRNVLAFQRGESETEPDPAEVEAVLEELV